MPELFIHVSETLKESQDWDRWLRGFYQILSELETLEMNKVKILFKTYPEPFKSASVDQKDHKASAFIVVKLRLLKGRSQDTLQVIHEACINYLQLSLKELATAISLKGENPSLRITFEMEEINPSTFTSIDLTQDLAFT